MMSNSIFAVGIVVFLVGCFFLFLAYFAPVSKGMGNLAFFYFGIVISLVGVVLSLWGVRKKGRMLRVNFLHDIEH